MRRLTAGVPQPADVQRVAQRREAAAAIRDDFVTALDNVQSVNFLAEYQAINVDNTTWQGLSPAQQAARLRALAIKQSQAINALRTLAIVCAKAIRFLYNTVAG
jgi:hypothetical protein